MSESTMLELTNFHLYIIALLIIAVTTAIYWTYKRWRRSVRNHVLLMGLCDAGKTAIFAQLVQSKLVSTHTSIKENVADYFVGNGKSVKLVDIPGHERLRWRHFDEYKRRAAAVVLVVDSATLQKQVRDVADCLHGVVADVAVAGARVLVLCHKQDELLAKSSAVIRTLLEQELAVVRSTHASKLQPLQEETQRRHVTPAEFSFDDAAIDFAQSEITEQNVQLQQLQLWLRKLA